MPKLRYRKCLRPSSIESSLDCRGCDGGLDFALALVAEMKSEEIARRVQVMIEYAPAHPFGTARQQRREWKASLRWAPVVSGWMDRRDWPLDRQARG